MFLFLFIPLIWEVNAISLSCRFGRISVFPAALMLVQHFGLPYVLKRATVQ